MRDILLCTSLLVSMIAVGQASEVASDSSAQSSPIADVIVVVGAAGEEDYGTDFRAAADQWEAACEKAGLHCVKIENLGTGKREGDGDSTHDTQSAKEDLLRQLRQWSASDERKTHWLVLIGHGTATPKSQEFNLAGPDVSDTEIAKELDAVQASVVVTCCFSSSGGWLPTLSGDRRVVITATANASELNYSRFGQYFAQSIADPNNDLDHDDEISLLEAFLAASHQTQRFYEEASRLVTEHALLDDNGDDKGTSAQFYEGLRIVKPATDGAKVDGSVAKQTVLVPSAASQKLSADQLASRTAIEAEFETLREQKSTLAEDEYYEQLEALMLRLHDVYFPPPVKSEQTPENNAK